METQAEARIEWSVWVTRLIGLWVLVGAAMKLLWGTPDHLPEILRELPLDLLVTYRVAIAAEFCIGFLALLRPRWSWLLVIALMLVFVATLVMQVLAGETSCGCFGTKLIVSPQVMLAVDGVLLILLLATRPWATPGSDATGGLIAIIVVVGAAILPWWLNREVETPDDIGQTMLDSGHVTLELRAWPDRRLADTRLWPWIKDLELDVPLPQDAVWIFYRDTCEWCAELLEVIRANELGQRNIVLLRLPPDEPGKASLIHELPTGVWIHHVELDDRVAWAVTPPAVFKTVDGRVVWAAEGVDVDEFAELDKR